MIFMSNKEKITIDSKGMKNNHIINVAKNISIKKNYTFKIEDTKIIINKPEKESILDWLDTILHLEMIYKDSLVKSTIKHKSIINSSYGASKIIKNRYSL